VADVLTGYTWDRSASRYRSGATGRYVARNEIVNLLGTHISGGENRVEALTRAMFEGTIAPATYAEQMRTQLRRLHLQNAALGAGGWDRLRPADYGRIGQRLRDDYGRINKLITDVQNGNATIAQALNRANGYVGNSRIAFWETERAAQSVPKPGKVVIERRVLGAKKNCPDCLRYYAAGWQPIGVLPVPAIACACGTHCGCRLERRQVPADEVGQWVKVPSSQVVQEIQPTLRLEERKSTIKKTTAEKEAEKLAKAAAKAAKASADKAAKEAAKAEAKAAKDVEKVALKAEKAAAKEAEKIAKAAVKEAAKLATKAQKEAARLDLQRKKEEEKARKAEEKARKEAEKAATPKPARKTKAEVAKPTTITTPTTTDSADVTAKLRDIEQKIYTQRYESAYAYTPDGKEILSRDGERYAVKLEFEEYAKLKGAIFTHNHPRGWDVAADDPRREGNSFSLSDVKVASVVKLKEVRAVTPVHTYRMLEPEGGWPNFVKDINPLYEKVDRSVIKELQQLVANGKMTEAQADNEHYHRTWSIVTKTLNIPYYKEEHGFNR
jgi:hypothetical protein